MHLNLFGRRESEKTLGECCCQTVFEFLRECFPFVNISNFICGDVISRDDSNEPGIIGLSGYRGSKKPLNKMTQKPKSAPFLQFVVSKEWSQGGLLGSVVGIALEIFSRELSTKNENDIQLSYWKVCDYNKSRVKMGGEDDVRNYGIDNFQKGRGGREKTGTKGNDVRSLEQKKKKKKFK